MYLKLQEVVLIGDTNRARPDDAIVYLRDYDGHEILTPDATPSRRIGPAVEYGRLYWDSRDCACVVPTIWHENHALLAADALPPSVTENE